MISKFNYFLLCLFLVSFTACSEDDDVITQEPDQETELPSNPDEGSNEDEILNLDFTVSEDLADYYSEVSFDVTVEELKEELVNLTSDKHTNFLEYWQRHDYLYDATEDPNNSDNVILVYSGESRPKNQYQSGNNDNSTQTFNTEHIYPRSKITVETGESDLHNFYPADIGINSSRGNYPFAEGDGSYSSMGTSWYPGDDWRGDIARIVMYMNIRYAQTFEKVGNIDLFLEWNAADPVSELEVQKNNAIEEAQGNRNPFIDNPYLATVIWGGDEAVNTWTTDYSGPISEEYTDNSDDSEDSENDDEEEDDNTGGDNEGSENAILMFSEYVEGGGNNKAIEILNMSEETADLTAFSIKKQVNGNGEWSNELQLSGSLAPGEVFVIINAQSDLQQLLDEADITQNGAPMDFNGDDPVGLFNNGTLIDMIGVSGDIDFGKDVTLRRKSTVDGPATTYDEDEWETFDKNNVENIGTY
ncbi:endonuclease [Zunongwangia endophytica]|uniref:Endonuclease n=1 Tax=Zunongwangia endophytica TaxID=1808945 RepID=A0ABV8HDI1_9FLAO|nr:endonuclease [Zunongwangia endophytica]MDN3593841.1 endonuclease [Zunongwangia endophytica]